MSGLGSPSPVPIMYTADNAPTRPTCDSLRIVTLVVCFLPLAQFPLSSGGGCSALGGFAGALPAEQPMGPGMAPAAALARDPPAAWYLAPVALAV